MTEKVGTPICNTLPNWDAFNIAKCSSSKCTLDHLNPTEVEIVVNSFLSSWFKACCKLSIWKA